MTPRISEIMPQTVKAWLIAPVTTKTSARFTAIFLALSCIVSAAFLSLRNIYDDEYSNFHYISLQASQVIHTANTTDVHPPGMYLLTWCAYHLIPSARWMNIFPLLFLYMGLAIFCFTLAPLFRTKASLLSFLLIATLHPQLLMWGNTIRWYSWWTGLALAAVTLALKPSAGTKTPFNYLRATVLALLLVSLFYLNYITLIFYAALVLAMLFRYGPGIWKPLTITAVLFAIGIYPQLRTFLAVHVPNGSKQSAEILLSSARLVQATLCSEAYLPWYPLAMAGLLLFAALLATGMVWFSRNTDSIRSAISGSPETRTLASIIVLALLFFAFVAVSGLGIKPRNGLILAPLLAIPIALIVNSIRWQLQAASLILISLWVGFGAEHLLLRKSLFKSNMINRPEDVASYIRDMQGENCNVIVTYDTLLTLTIATANLPRTSLLTPEKFPLPMHHAPSPSQCNTENLYLVRSSLNDITDAEQIRAEMSAVDVSLPNPATRKFSFDPDAAMKRRLASLLGGSDVPDYRYVVTSAQVSQATLIEIEKHLQHFAPADGSPKPQ